MKRAKFALLPTTPSLANPTAIARCRARKIARKLARMEMAVSEDKFSLHFLYDILTRCRSHIGYPGRDPLPSPLGISCIQVP